MIIKMRRTFAVALFVSASAVTWTGQAASASTKKLATSRITAVADFDVKQFLNRWLYTQNRGQFDAYGQLYAQHFTGVRRSGSRVVQLGHDAWLRDRAGMFKHPMKVQLSDLQIVLVSSGAITTFTQDWASPTYKDTGRKRILLKKGNGGAIQIVREEMLASTIVSHEKSDAEHVLRFAFWFGPDGILLTNKVDEEWGQGTARLAGDVGTHATYKEVNAKKLPTWYADLVGRSVLLRDKSGRKLDAKITGFRLVSRFRGDFLRSSLDPNSQELLEGDALAEKYWEAGSKFLVATVDAAMLKSFPVQWAQAEDSPLVPMVPSRPAAELERQLVTEFRNLKVYKELQQLYKETSPSPAQAHWEEYESQISDRGVVELTTPTGSRRFAYMGFESGIGCGQGFYGALHAVWEVKNGDHGPTFVLLGTNERAIRIQAVADIDADGSPEFLFEDHSIEDSFGYFKIDRKGSYEFTTFTVPYLGCPC